MVLVHHLDPQLLEFQACQRNLGHPSLQCLQFRLLLQDLQWHLEDQVVLQGQLDLLDHQGHSHPVFLVLQKVLLHQKVQLVLVNLCFPLDQEVHSHHQGPFLLVYLEDHWFQGCQGLQEIQGFQVNQ